MHEQDRIEFLLRRDGFEATIAWVERTLRIYRAAVLDRGHFASRREFRRGFIESYCDFKRWLATARPRKSIEAVLADRPAVLRTKA